MPHSHMPVQHLLKQVEIYRSKKQEPRDVRPDWLTAFIENIAELFEPLADDGRAGFECQLVDDLWVLEMYLGATEIVGGPEDGELRYTNFQFDLNGLLDRFDEIERFRWNALPDVQDENRFAGRSSIVLTGRTGEHRLRMNLYSVPPDDAGPGFREFSDGRREPA